MSVASRVYRDRVYFTDGLPELVSLIRPEEKRILDVGAGNGANARLMVTRGKEVHALTLSEREAALLRSVCHSVRILDLETESARDSFPPNSFDAIVCSHVLEHLRQPERCLRWLSTVLRQGGRIYVALPNIAFYRQRVEFAAGRFEYTEWGLLDRTHLRFYTYRSGRCLVADAGYSIVMQQAIGSVPLWPLRGILGHNTWLDRWGCRLAPNLFGWHILVVGEKCTPVETSE